MKSAKTFCFCCKLETGAYVLSTIGLITCFLSIVLTALVLGQVIQLTLPEPLLISQLTWSIIEVILLGLVVCGTKKRKSCMMIPYLFFGFVGLMVNAFSFVAYQIIDSDHDPVTRLAISLRYTFIATVGFYTWYCILTLFTKLKIEENANGDNSELVS